MDLNSREYYIARAAVSRSLARASQDPQIAQIHADFARKYIQAAEQIDAETARIVHD